MKLPAKMTILDLKILKGCSGDYSRTITILMEDSRLSTSGRLINKNFLLFPESTPKYTHRKLELMYKLETI